MKANCKGCKFSHDNKKNTLIFDECADGEKVVYWLSPCEIDGHDYCVWGNLLGREREALMINGYFLEKSDIKKYISENKKT